MKVIGEQLVLSGMGEGTQIVLPNLETPSESVEQYEPQHEQIKYLDPESEEARIQRQKEWEEDHSGDEREWWQK